MEPQAQCFNPRHGIRVMRNGKQDDLVICFECLSFRLYGASEGGFVITDTPKALFDEVLRKTAFRLWIPRLLCTNEVAHSGRMGDCDLIAYGR